MSIDITIHISGRPFDGPSTGTPSGFHRNPKLMPAKVRYIIFIYIPQGTILATFIYFTYSLELVHMAEMHSKARASSPYELVPNKIL